MASQLSQVADGIRIVGTSSGPVATGVAAAKRRATTLAAAIPRSAEAPSAANTVHALEEGSRHLAAAEAFLQQFALTADRFAQRLAMGASAESLALDRARAQADALALPLAEAAPHAFETASNAIDTDAAARVAPDPPDGRRNGEKTPDWATDRGLQLVDVNLADFSDNPILDSFTRGGLTRQDYVWALTTWRDIVEPGLNRGLTADDFRDMDARSGAQPTRRVQDVYDIMLGSDPIHISQRPDGSWDVIGGRHRLEVARSLGISRLPAMIHPRR